MTRTKKTKRKCVLCGAALAPSPYDGFFLHPQVETCKVVVTDVLGVSVDDDFECVDGEIYAREAPATDTAAPVQFGNIVFNGNADVIIGDPSNTAYVSVDSACARMFAEIGEPYLGGSSGSRGWSSVSAFQRCPYLWRSKYGGKPVVSGDVPGPDALEIGSLTHIFLAIHYSQRINPAYPIDPEQARRFLMMAPVTPSVMDMAWNLFDSYRAYWGAEPWMKPLAVEELAVDPRTGFSCRWDLVFEVLYPFENMLPGVYVCNSKTSAQNSMVTREQWQNDGQILGEIDLYDRLGYHRRWGKLRAACINLLIKTKTPQFLRSFVYPKKKVIRDHHKSLKIWDATIKLAEATGNFPRARAACITRWQGFCELFDHCAGGDDDAPREIES